MHYRTVIRKQESYLQVRCFKEELEAAKTAAKQEKVSLSQFVRSRVLANLQIIPFQSVPAPEAPKISNQILTEHSNGKHSNEEIEGIVSKKFSHRLFCNCVPCEKERRRLERFLTGKRLASDRPPSPAFAANKRKR